MTYIEKAQIRRNCTLYPEITTAAIEGPEAVDGALKFTFTRALGTKG
jgi:PRTRC genetic system protein C